MRNTLIKLANSQDKSSLAHKFRRQRFKHFLEFLDQFEKPVSILDVGGTFEFWENMNINLKDIKISICNLDEQVINGRDFAFIKCDGRNMSSFEDKQFDIVFSNSVIEHAGNFDEQRRMANEIARVGKSYFIQTPNHDFPIEPHFLFPFFQFLPVWLKIFLVRNFNLGWYTKQKNHKNAIELVNSVNLLTKKQMSELFPGSIIVKERFWGIVKSLTAVMSIY